MQRNKRNLWIVILILVLVVLIIGITSVMLFSNKNNGTNDKANNNTNMNQETIYNEWTQLDNYTVTKGNTVLKIGDTVDYSDMAGSFNNGVYNEKYTGEWKVLGAEKGNLLIVSTANVDYSRIGDYSNLELAQDSYLNGVENLNEMCKKYGTGEGAVGARSINVEDINKLTGYNPIEHKNKTINSYDNETTFYWDGTIYPYYISTNGSTGNLNADHSKFIWCDGNKWNTVNLDTNAIKDPKTEITTITNTSYSYQLLEENLKNTNANIYNLILNQSNDNYWLASNSIETSEYWVSYGMFTVYEGKVTELSCVYSSGSVNSYMCGVRAVVMIGNNVNLEGSSETSWKISLQEDEEDSSIIWGNNTLNIGDKIEYDDKAGANGNEKYTGEWKVLGLENGKLLIVSASSVEEKRLIEINDLSKAQDAYVNGVKYLNEVCEKYGTGKGATGARSITLEDINKLTGYNVKKDISKKNKVEEYGNTINFYWDADEKPSYKSTNNASGGFSRKHSKFVWYDGNVWHSVNREINATNDNMVLISTKDNIKATITNTSQAYVMNNETEFKTNNPKINDLIFSNISASSNGYWLATQCSYFNGSAGYYGMHYIGNGLVGSHPILSTDGSSYVTNKGVTVVVELSSDVELTGTSEAGWTIK